MTGFPDLLPTLLCVGLLMAVAVGLLAAFRIPHASAPALAILRGAAQLAVISLILGGVITSPVWVGAALLVMFSVAAVTASRRLGWAWSRLAVVGGSMAAGIVVTLAIDFGTGAIAFTPRYALAIGGIVIGNAMTIATLSGRHFAESVNEHWDEVEAWLALGATRRQSTLETGPAGRLFSPHPLDRPDEDDRPGHLAGRVRGRNLRGTLTCGSRPLPDRRARLDHGGRFRSPPSRSSVPSRRSRCVPPGPAKAVPGPSGRHADNQRVHRLAVGVLAVEQFRTSLGYRHVDALPDQEPLHVAGRGSAQDTDVHAVLPAAVAGADRQYPVPAGEFDPGIQQPDKHHAVVAGDADVAAEPQHAGTAGGIVLGAVGGETELSGRGHRRAVGSGDSAVREPRNVVHEAALDAPASGPAGAAERVKRTLGSRRFSWAVGRIYPLSLAAGSTPAELLHLLALHPAYFTDGVGGAGLLPGRRWLTWMSTVSQEVHRGRSHQQGSRI